MTRRKRKLFTPFVINQMRWALLVYRWKEDVGWKKFHLTIAHVLDVRNLDQWKLNENDVKRFIGGASPGEEKLEIYKKFIQKVMPDYLSNDTDEDELIKLANVLTNFTDRDEAHEREEILRRFATKIEQSVYVDYSNLGEHNNYSPDILILRKIGSTPFLFAQVFQIDVLQRVLDSTKSFSENINLINGDKKHRHKICETIGSIREDIPTINYRAGVFVPAWSSGYYFGILNDYKRSTIQAHLVDCLYEVDNRMKQFLSNSSDVEGVKMNVLEIEARKVKILPEITGLNGANRGLIIRGIDTSTTPHKSIVWGTDRKLFFSLYESFGDSEILENLRNISLKYRMSLI